MSLKFFDAYIYTTHKFRKTEANINEFNLVINLESLCRPYM